MPKSCAIIVCRKNIFFVYNKWYHKSVEDLYGYVYFMPKYVVINLCCPEHQLCYGGENSYHISFIFIFEIKRVIKMSSLEKSDDNSPPHLPISRKNVPKVGKAHLEQLLK